MKPAWLALLLLCSGCAAGGSGDWLLRAQVRPATEPATFSRSTIVVATYNLHGLRDVEGLKSDLRRIDADAWLFEEVRASADLRAILSEPQRWNIIMVPVNPMGQGEIEAQAIATRLPVESVEVWPLESRSSGSSRRRCALVARVKADSREVLLVDTDHEPGYFSFSIAHEPQLRSLAERLDETYGIAIVGGDFNTCGNFWRLRSSHADAQTASRFLAARGLAPATQPTVTFTAGPVRGYLDQIYVRGARVEDGTVASDSRGSDHRPVVARISWD